jgi:hypothetical protein
MGVLKTIEEIFGKIDFSIVKDDLLYLELDKENSKLLDEEIENYSDQSIIIKQEKVKDMGTAKVLSYLGHRIIVVTDKNVKNKLDDFYVAFKTKIV